MTLNGSGIRDTARVLKISPTKVVIRLADEAEVDEMGSYVGRKKEPRWLGMRLITAVAKSWRMCLVVVKRRSS